MNIQEGSPISYFNAELKLKGFKVYEIDSTESVVRNYNRKDFYKICLITARILSTMRTEVLIKKYLPLIDIEEFKHR